MQVKQQALGTVIYSSTVIIHEWIVHATGCNGKPIKFPNAERIMESNASTTGWVTSCQGVQTGSQWDQREAQMHINWLELKATFIAMETFAAKWMNVHGPTACCWTTKLQL